MCALLFFYSIFYFERHKLFLLNKSIGTALGKSVGSHIFIPIHYFILPFKPRSYLCVGNLAKSFVCFGLGFLYYALHTVTCSITELLYGITFVSYQSKQIEIPQLDEAIV